MIDEERVRLMTGLATFEKRKGKRDTDILNYFRGDYIGFQVLKAIIAGTISFVAIYAIVLFYNFEEIMAEVYNMDFMQEGKHILTTYLSFVGIYAVIVYIVYTYKYAKAKKELKGFYADLRKLEGMTSRQRIDEEFDDD